LIEWPEKIEKLIKKKIEISFIKKKTNPDIIDLKINFFGKKRFLKKI
tara:strand:+ start:1458 stop:1598 length:141 start_codon:yes stop_codon:yes gene_type:complete